MSNPYLVDIKKDLDERQSAGLLRRRRLLEGPQGTHVTIDGQSVLSFCSNDYLGLANHPSLIEAVKRSAETSGVGSGASHLITGHHQLHHALEDALAEFVRLPRALLFSSGYMANIGVVPALVGRGDAVFADRLNHASLNDAVVLSRADLKRYPHNDLAALERLLKTSKAPRKLVLADAVFSMDGDQAPVNALLSFCESYDAWLMLDDAHGFGVLGGGRGILEETKITSDRVIYMATLGKAAGVSGAFVAGESVLIDSLIQHARSYVYTTASPPCQSAALLASLKLIEQEQWRRDHLRQLIQMLGNGLSGCRWKLAQSFTPIQPLMVGSNAEALDLSERLLERNILVPAIRPPTVPAGTSRLRISLSAGHSIDDVAQLVDAIHQVAEH